VNIFIFSRHNSRNSQSLKLMTQQSRRENDAVFNYIECLLSNFNLLQSSSYSLNKMFILFSTRALQ